MAGGEIGLAEGHGDRRRRIELLHDQLEDGFDECRVDLDLVDHELNGVRILADGQGYILKCSRFFGGLPQAIERLGARVEFPARAGYDPSGFDLVNLHALLALGWPAEILFGLKTGGFREDAQDHVSVADLYRLLVRSALSGLRSIKRVTDVALGSDQKLDGPGSVTRLMEIGRAHV